MLARYVLKLYIGYIWNKIKKKKKATWQYKNATKIFDYTTIADRLLAVSWINNIHSTGVVKQDAGIPTLPLNAKAM